MNYLSSRYGKKIKDTEILRQWQRQELYNMLSVGEANTKRNIFCLHHFGFSGVCSKHARVPHKMLSRHSKAAKRHSSLGPRPYTENILNSNFQTGKAFTVVLVIKQDLSTVLIHMYIFFHIWNLLNPVCR